MKDEIEKEIIEAHDHCDCNKDELMESSVCGCFFCLNIFSPKEIKEWTPLAPTALCPHCGIDAVIGDKSGYPITEEFLGKMKKYWFY